MRSNVNRSRTRDEVYATLQTMEVGDHRTFRLTQRKDAQLSVYYFNRRKSKTFITKADDQCVNVWRVN